MTHTFDVIEPGLALSGAPATLPAGSPFQVILNVWDPTPPAYAARLPAEVALVHEPFEDGLPVPVAFARRAVLELANARRGGLFTLVHCQAGQSRSPAVIALYLMARDGLSWGEACARIKARRPFVDPHPQLLDQDTRSAVVAAVRRFLAGDDAILTGAREDAERLRRTDRERSHLPPGGPSDWSFIEDGLGCGSSSVPRRELVRAGFRGFLTLGTPHRRAALNESAGGDSTPHDRGLQQSAVGLRETEPVDTQELAAVVELVRRWRGASVPSFVACTDGRSLSALVLALFLMVERGFDFAGAMWFIRRRRRGAWPRPQLLDGRSPRELFEACRSVAATRPGTG